MTGTSKAQPTTRKIEVSGEEKEMMAMGLLLYREWKCQGRFDVDTILPVIKLADKLGLKQIYEQLQRIHPPMRITER